METRKKNTTAGVLFWTPAPVRFSPTSSVASEDGWEDEDEDMTTEKDEDFHSHMDENGIIGLKEALDDVDLGQNYGDGRCNPPWYARTLNPEEASPGGPDGLSLALELGMPPEELQDSDPLSHTELPENTNTLSLYDDMGGSVEVWPEDEELRQRAEEEEEEQRWLERLPERNTQLDMTTLTLSSTSGLGTMPQLVENHIAQGDNVKISSTGSDSADLLTLEVTGPSKRSSRQNRTPDSVACASGSLSPFSPSNLVHPIPLSPSPPRSPVLPHLLHFSSEELADVSAIEAETFPETGFTESLPESRSSRLSHTPKAHWSHESEGEELKSRASPKPASISPEQGTVSNRTMGRSGKSTVNHHKQPTPSPRKMRQRSPETTYPRTRPLNKSGSSKSNGQTASPDRGLRTPRESPFKTQANTINAEVDEARKGPLSYRTPDFSKVEPRVHFPKSGYKPPKSRGSPKKKSPSAERPLVFKSPADIVREVLLSATDGPPPPTDSNGPPTCAPNSTVPEEFRCPQQATTLIDQLQEDYNRLLTKYAEAENTIDRLRLEAKVNLYSDPPKPSHSVQSGVIQEGSKLMMLNFPQAQRAEISSGPVHQDGPGAHHRVSPRPSSAASLSSRTSLGPQMGQQVTRTLSRQASKFLWQVQTFEDLLKSRRLNPSEAMTGLSQLVQGLDSLERSYLVARDEHRLHQHRGGGVGPFDPDRELEGLIFQCGMGVEELKEQVEQMGQDPPTSEAPPSASPPPHPTPLSVPTEGGGYTPRPESPVSPEPGESGGVVGGEVSSASGESDGEEAGMEDEEASLFLKPLHCKHRLVEQDHYQSFEELPTPLDGGLQEGLALFPAAGNGMRPGEEGRPGQDQNSRPQRRAKSDHQDSAPLPTSHQRTSRSDPPSPRASSQSPAPHLHLPGGSRRLEVGKSHSSSLTSLGESASSERRGSKLQPGPRRVLSQDGIISPETDSGFVGSESSRLTPAAVPSPLHQRAPASVSVPQEGNPGNPRAGPVSGRPLPASSPSPRRRTSLELGSPGPLRGRPRRTRGGDRRGTSTSTSSSPPGCWAGQTPRTRADSGTSDFGLDSDHTHTASEEEGGQNDRFAESADSQRGYRPGPPPAAPHHHGDPLRALGSGQVTNRNEAIQNLQAEVTRLKERLERSLGKTKPLSPVRAPPSAQGSCSHHDSFTPRVRSGQRWRDGGEGERRERRRDDELEEECSPRPAHRRRSSSAPRQRPDITTDSDHSTPRPHLSRRIPTSPAAPQNCCGCSNVVRSRITPTRKHPGLSAGVYEAADEPDSRGSKAPVCLLCSSHHHGHSARPEGGVSEPLHASSHCRHGPLCGQPEPDSSTEPVRRREREPDPPAHRSHRPTGSLDRGVRPRYSAAPGPPVLGGVPLVHCVPVCPPPVLFYSSPVVNMDSYPQPLCVPVSSGGASAGVRGRGEARGRADEQHSLSGSLDRAIRAARDMKHTSRRMARSLAAGLPCQDTLAQSCIY